MMSDSATADVNKSRLKAKIQLASSGDYMNFLQLLNSPKIGGSLHRVFVQRDYVIDGDNHELWNSGFTLSIRYTEEHFPVESVKVKPACSVTLKESIFQNFVDEHGKPLNIPTETNGSPGVPADCLSSVYEIKETEEPVEWNAISHLISGKMIVPSECSSRLIAEIHQTRPVVGGIRCIGSFASTRHVYIIPNYPEIEIDRCQFPHGEGFFVRFAPDDETMLRIFGLLHSNEIKYEINLKTKTELFFMGITPSSIASTTRKILLPHDNQSITTDSRFNTDLPTSPSIMSDTTAMSKSTNSTAASQAANKRGRKSLVKQLLEQPTSPQVVPIISTMKVDPTQLQGEGEVQQIVHEYHKKKSSEASARYRKRKQDEMNTLKSQIAELTNDVNYWKRRCQELETKVNAPVSHTR